MRGLGSSIGFFGRCVFSYLKVIRSSVWGCSQKVRNGFGCWGSCFQGLGESKCSLVQQYVWGSRGGQGFSIRWFESFRFSLGICVFCFLFFDVRSVFLSLLVLTASVRRVVRGLVGGTFIILVFIVEMGQDGVYVSVQKFLWFFQLRNI